MNFFPDFLLKSCSYETGKIVNDPTGVYTTHIYELCECILCLIHGTKVINCALEEMLNVSGILPDFIEKRDFVENMSLRPLLNLLGYLQMLDMQKPSTATVRWFKNGGGQYRFPRFFSTSFNRTWIVGRVSKTPARVDFNPETGTNKKNYGHYGPQPFYDGSKPRTFCMKIGDTSGLEDNWRDVFKNLVAQKDFKTWFNSRDHNEFTLEDEEVINLFELEEDMNGL